MKKFVISEDERSRILSMHESATKRQYLSEQPDQGVAPKAVKREVTNYQFWDYLPMASVDKNTFPDKTSFDNYVSGVVPNIRAYQQMEDGFRKWCGMNGPTCVKNFKNSGFGKNIVTGADGNTNLKLTQIEMGHLISLAMAEAITNKQLDTTATRQAFNKLKVNTNNFAGMGAGKGESLFKKAVEDSLNYKDPFGEA